jgi:hypothetical protein
MINPHFVEPDLTAALILDDETVERYVDHLTAAR